MSCENCGKHVASGSNNACVIEGKVYPINDYPVLSSACGSFELKESVSDKVKKKSKDPLENFIKTKLSKPTPTAPVPPKEIPTEKNEINFKYALGWVISAILGGTLIAVMLIGGI